MSPLETAIRVIVELLVRREYDAIARLTHCRRLSASDLQHAVLSYGRKLARPPDGWIDLVDVVPIDDREQAAFFAAVPLWTEEEGRSDLTLELRLSEFAPQLYDTEVLDVHVL